MKTYFYTTILLLINFQYSFSQKINITWGKESKKELNYYSFVKGNNNDLIKLCFETHSGKKITPVLTRYDNKINELTSETFKASESGVFFNGFFNLNNNLYLLTNTFNRNKRQTNFYAQQINSTSLKPEKQNVILDSIQTSSSITKKSDSEHLISQDSTKLLLISYPSEDKKEDQIYNVSVFDSNMDKLWSRKIELPYKAKFIEILNKSVTNEGRVCLLLKHYESGRVREKIRINNSSAPAYSVKLLIYENDKSEVKDFNINIGNKFIHTLQIAEDKGNDLTLFGLYCDKANDVINGFFTVDINKTNYDVSIANIKNFPPTLLSILDKDKQGDDHNKNPGLSNLFQLAKVINKDNGDKSFILEYRTTITAPKSASYFLYGNIIDINLKKNGEIVLTRIPKYQISYYSNYTSFQVLAHHDKLIFFYNDAINNISRDLSKRPSTANIMKGNSALVTATINSSGGLTRKVLQTNKETNFIVAIKNCIVLDNNKIGLYASKNSKFGLSKDLIGLLEIH